MTDNSRTTASTPPTAASATEVADAVKERKKVGHRSHMAGAFDIRNVIGALLGIYGLVLLISYFLLDPGQSTMGEAKDSIYNLWSGLGMLAVAALFLLWSKFEPIKIDEE